MDLPGHEGEELPIPITSTFATAHGHAPLHPSNGLFTPPAAATTTTTTTTIAEEASSCNRRKGVAMVTYRECLRNHAAAIGGSALDGCGEFMPSGEEGTLEALKCSACSCHRNFHRKEVDLHHHHYHHHLMGRKVVAHHKGVLISASTDGYGYSLQARPATQMVMPLGALQASDYYWDQDMEGAGAGGLGLDRGAPVGKKRFRTKFTPEQKEKMLSFAEKVGWRLQNQEDALVQEFCQEVGVKRRVLKVWMHNNKHTLAQKAAPPLQLG